MEAHLRPCRGTGGGPRRQPSTTRVAQRDPSRVLGRPRQDQPGPPPPGDSSDHYVLALVLLGALLGLSGPDAALCSSPGRQS